MANLKKKSALEQATDALGEGTGIVTPEPAASTETIAPAAAPIAAAPIALVPTPAPVPAQVQVALRPAIMGKGFGLAEFRRRRWRADLKEGETFENVVDPVFWRHQADLIMGQDKNGGRGDIIEVWKIDNSGYREFLIVEVGKGFVKLKPQVGVDPEVVNLPEGCPIEIKWNDSRKANDVVRKSDNAVMDGGFQSKQSALDWIVNHLKAMAA